MQIAEQVKTRNRGDSLRYLVNESPEVRLLLQILPKTLVFSAEDVRFITAIE